MIVKRKKSEGHEIVMREPFRPTLKSPYSGPSEYSNWQGEAAKYYEGKPKYFDPETNPGMGYREKYRREEELPEEEYVENEEEE